MSLVSFLWILGCAFAVLWFFIGAALPTGFGSQTLLFLFFALFALLAVSSKS